MKKLRSSDPKQRLAAAVGFSRLKAGATPVLAAVIDALKDDNPQVRSFACQAIAGIGPPAKAAVPALMDLLKEKDVPLWAIIALGNIGPDAREALPRLRELAKEGGAGISNEAEAAIKRIEP